MANYSIQRSDLATGNVTVTEASTNTATNVTLIGQNFTGYGDEIATNFLQMLENFATDVDPTTNPRVVGAVIRGQLWYDTTGTGTLKVYNGASFDELSKVSDGTTESSTLRWNNTAGRYQAEERVRVTDAGALIVDAAAAGTNAVTISHDTTDLNIVGAGTADINITSGITAVNLPAITLVTVLDETYGGTGIITYATGDIVYASGADTLIALGAGANGEILTLAGGVPTWASAGAGVSVLDDLTDVTAAGAPTGAILVKSAGDWIVATGLSYDDTGNDLTVTNIAGIAEGDLVDKSAAETIAGAWIFSNATPINATGGDILASSGNGLSASNGAGAIAIRHTGTVVNFTHSSTTDWNISGISNQIYIDGSPVEIDNVTGEALVLQGNAVGNTNTSWITFRDSAGTAQGEMGMTNSTAALRIKGISAGTGVELVGTDSNVKLDLGGAGTALRGYNASNVASFITAAVGTSSKTSRLTIYNDINIGSGGYSVGYNETPQANGGALAAGGTYTVTIDDIGLFLTRTTTSATTISFGTLATSPTGATVLVHNDNSGTCTIAVSGMTLEWVDGSGGAAPTGNRTLAQNSVATLRKKSGSVWQIWGNGIS